MVPAQLGFQGCQVNNHPVHVAVLFVMIIVSALIQQSLLYLSLCVKVQRETLGFPAQVAVLVSPVLKEKLVSLVPLVLQVAAALLGLQDWLCRAPKDSKDHLGRLEEQV